MDTVDEGKVATDALIVVLDAQGCIVDFNDAAEWMTGYRRDEAKGRNWCEILAPMEEHAQFLSQVAEFRAGRENESSGFSKVITKSGGQRLLKWQMMPVRDQGNLRGIVAVGFDPSGAMPASPHESENELHKILSAVEQSPVSVIITDMQGCIEYSNRKVTEVTGFPRQDLIGNSISALESEEMASEEYNTLLHTITSGLEWQGDIHTKTKSGDRVYQHATVSSIRNRQGEVTHHVAILEDITVRKRLEQQLHEAQKMEAVGTLAGGIAHDFNNLLTAINGYSDLLLDRINSADPMRREVEEIKRAGERATQLTRQLLAFGRKQVLRPRVLDLNQVLTETHELITGLIRDRIELVTCLQPNLGLVKADPGQIEQVIMNVVINARDAMPEGGKLVILTANVSAEPNDVIKHPGMKSGSYVLLAVSDTGVGMDAETLSRIFEPFFTTKEVGKGTGLGLSTAYGIVKQSGGYIYASSQPGKGSTFEIYLPRDDSA